MKAKCSKCGQEYTRHSMVYVNGALVCASCYLGQKTNDSNGKEAKKMIYRLRKTKRRYGMSFGRCYVGYHLGKRSLYIPHDKKITFALNDWHGLTEVVK